METSTWKRCIDRLECDLPSQQFNLWIRPLQAIEQENSFCLLAPNKFVYDWISENYLKKITELLQNITKNKTLSLSIEIGSHDLQKENIALQASEKPENTTLSNGFRKKIRRSTNLNNQFILANFVEGKSNQVAKAAAIQVSKNPGKAYNPLFICGGVGLGKTHLMQAIGHALIAKNSSANIVYLHSERFVFEMVSAIQHNTINTIFKQFYRNLDILLIDDIQFFAGKEQSQEEFFHTFNTLIEAQNQIVLTCDRYPKEVEGLEERLKSRFGCGLTVSIDPPELETRIAIINKKVPNRLPEEVSFFIAEKFKSNVRELEGVLNSLIANSNFTGREITIEFTKEVLHNLLLNHEKQPSIEDIQKTTAHYYKMRVSDLLSKKRKRSLTLPRHIAMAMAKEFTKHSLPEIGEAFGGRDHTTVLYACRKIQEKMENDKQLQEDYKNLTNILTN